ncbi:peptidoglycan-binding protein [Microvirga sp. 3-52]|uniref:peptidoglycan-binding protein n=1 Tax=Microvirga sp. 3-52 TaxID=2792425 RepID=UPI001AC3F5AD|nr:peptidoglycan-binding protein [Microvirga sp. 3-52]MBO1908442.1 peptidoglycan-binding protein [Microvirga sp. 3-52]MBS7455257.1 peptidoglycan-binding protein [Microvirga sp. 3-52]
MHFGQPSGFAGGSSVRKSTLAELGRMHPILFLGSIVFALSLLLMSGVTARAAGRVALVLTAEDYQKLPKSSIGTKRGAEIAEALKARGFELIVSPNPSNATARASLRDFAAKAEGADLAFVVLIGHGVAWGGQTFFLATNTELGRATDLLSRALSTTNIAQIVGRAQTGGVFFFMTSPTFESPIEGLDPRPQFTSEAPKNTVAVFSSSARIPVSRIDAAGEQAAEALTKMLQQPSPSLSEAVKVASNGSMGAVFGRVDEISLAKPAPAPAAQSVASTAPQAAAAQRSEEIEGKLEAERRAREQAETRARDEQLRAERAQAEVLKAQADAKKAQADVERAQADAEKAKQEAKRVEAQAQIAATQVEGLRHVPVAAPIEDTQLGQKQRRLIQQRLRELGLYTGPIDAIMGPLTREAIMGYQKSRSAAVTGYLTPEQFDALLPNQTE